MEDWRGGGSGAWSAKRISIWRKPGAVGAVLSDPQPAARRLRGLDS